ncbi:Gfo/Idh/MocA family oxidoreductase [Burkholderia multivorans]|uniref:Gfo/Idh/MocA family protein n=1 Tax=Burkholderia multivorans TaxID=87883 RepID=UPI000D00762C|nr:Gfo/Idh/MocA family oxidoreductase [Burkholderia multivorans]MBU9231779.1 Gfo/Idh/MocA family oxidoreductase [Burkholderia multivorans]MCA8318446.1 Gfo/Idh/MocA family oxidoreductase [Burkholderia multivorans]MDN7479066.1 Gfo/Idh/MocA family oxidoreductase [Burkholderia multivorans]PRE00345.1 oxidoreductase [Burkholderia multivorans]QGR91058.1 gfo/Idh/MocA family oxidoreductase [Burkholderia multivorans]
MKETRIAVAGAGYIGLEHIRVVRESATCTLSAVIDPSDVAADVAKKAGVPHYRSLDELFEKDRPDGVVLATPNTLHAEHARLSIQAGVPMLLEKPIATTVEQAEALVADVERYRASVLIGHHRAHSPIMMRAKEIIDEGRLGSLVAVMGSALFFKPDRYFADAPWRKQRGGGPILLNMIHEIHNLRMLCGDIVAVQAFSSRATRGLAVEDTVAINLRFAGGALGTFLLSDTAASARSWEQTSQENRAYASYSDEDCYVIAGTFGSLSIPTMRLKTYGKDGDRSWWKPFDVSVAAIARDDPLRRQMEHFGRVVRGEATPIVTARDGLQNLRIIEAIVKAAQTGTVVETTSL